ncbi:SspB family protein [Aurantimonas sp. VKM B-3413]|uniref:SspB family protein n=1 Tax=Aurantimonas sp. VKM B-3413 TaxID=2779401 RepID=UPI001E51677F|nr:SspB family protein [Aurantimonas sp. VKM B-3413]MCB8835883.1 SspB family protein [Aurantimonas sp. VKM B-3413]
MGQDLIRYDVLAQDALRGVIRKVLGEVVKTGLPGEHHFFITFLTSAPGVRISSRLREKYPELMTIVIQHQYWDLQVNETAFEVGLSFSDIPERLLVPFSAIRGFYDPAVNFELEFDVQSAEAANTQGEAVEPIPLEPVAPQPVAPLGKPAKLPARQKAEAGSEEEKSPAEDGDDKAAEKKDAQVVSLDAFRKKT